MTTTTISIFFFTGAMICFLGLSILYFIRIAYYKKEMREKDIQNDSNWNAFLLLHAICSEAMNVGIFFPEIKKGTFNSYCLDKIIGNKIIEKLNNLEISSLLLGVYENGENWVFVKTYLEKTLSKESAYDLYVAYLAYEINNKFKIGKETPEMQIFIAKNLGFEIIKKTRNSQLLNKKVDEWIKELDFGPERKQVLRGEIKKLKI